MPKPRCVSSTLREAILNRYLVLSTTIWLLVLVGCSSGEKSETSSDSQLIRSQLGLLTGQEVLGVLEASNRQVEDAIASCMSDAGFSYWPLKLTDTAAVTAAQLDSKFSAEYIESYGFGGATIGPPREPQSDAVRKNDEELQALSPSGQTQYLTALQRCQEDGAAKSPDVSEGCRKF